MRIRLADLAAVGAGGAVGALVRVALVVAFPTPDTAFPLTTFVENLLGAFLLGAAARWVALRRPTERLRLFLTTGALGAFTTYSTHAVEIALRIDAGRPVLAAGYALATAVGGVALAALGWRLAGAALRGPRR